MYKFTIFVHPTTKTHNQVMANRNASSSAFGWDFQVNAAIVIMLDNIKEMTAIRLEGNEDIEVNLDDGTSILAQAKSVVRSSEDFTNVTTNLKKSLTSLSEAYNSTKDVKKLIYITNSPNPLHIEDEKYIFAGLSTRRSYDSLPQKSKDKIDGILSNITAPLDKSKLMIQTLPFETDEDKERYKFVWYEINEFLSQIGTDRISKTQLHNTWKGDIFCSGTKSDRSIKLSKKDIIWPVIVILTEKAEIDEELDESELEEVSRAYADIINTCSEKFELFTKVLYAYNGYQTDKKQKERRLNFILNESKQFSEILEDDTITIDNDLKDVLLKIIVKKILDKRYQINRIKQEVNL